MELPKKQQEQKQIRRVNMSVNSAQVGQACNLAFEYLKHEALMEHAKGFPDGLHHNIFDRTEVDNRSNFQIKAKEFYELIEDIHQDIKEGRY